MKTAQTIEQLNAEQKSATKPKRKMHPNSLANLVAPWTPETKPKSPGRPVNTASRICRDIIEKNEEQIYLAYGKALLTGSPYALDVVSKIAYGDIKKFVHMGDEEGGPIQASIKVEFVKPDGQ